MDFSASIDIKFSENQTGTFREAHRNRTIGGKIKYTG